MGEEKKIEDELQAEMNRKIDIASVLQSRQKISLAETKSMFTAVFTQNPKEYLESAESDIQFSDVLASDKSACSPFRFFLAKLPQVESFCSLFAVGLLIANVDLTVAYDIWQDIEQLKSTYFELTVNDLKRTVSFCVLVFVLRCTFDLTVSLTLRKGS